MASLSTRRRDQVEMQDSPVPDRIAHPTVRPATNPRRSQPSTSLSGLPVPPDISFAESLNYCLRSTNSLLTSCGGGRSFVAGERKCLALGPDLFDDVVQDVGQSPLGTPARKGADLSDVGDTPGHVFEADFVRNFVR